MPANTLNNAAAETTAASAQRLRRTMAAVRVSLHWFGVRKSLTTEQKSHAAESFGAAGDFLSARKKLLDTAHPVYRALTAIRGRIRATWIGVTLPYPEPGLRLIRQDRIPTFHETLQDLRTELHEAVASLEACYAELKEAARQRLGQLYNADDYPATLQGGFDLTWDFPSVEPPDYLLQLSPGLYEQERARVMARFEEAVRLAEQAFLTEFARLVTHLTERLSTDAAGERKVFRDSAVTNLQEFFARFRELDVRSNEQLDQLVTQAQRLVQGIAPQELRDNGSLRQQLATQMAGVQATLDGLLIDRPRRSLIRPGRTNGGAP